KVLSLATEAVFCCPLYLFRAKEARKRMSLPSGLGPHLNNNRMNKIEHIGIAVKDLAVSNEIFEKLFGAPPYKSEEVKSEGVKTSFFMNGPNKIELLQATTPDSPIAKFIDKKGEGIHHIAFDVTNIEAEISRLKAEGFQILNETPKRG